MVAIPIDWKATNALYEFFVVFLFLGLVLGLVFGVGGVVGAIPMEWKATNAMVVLFLGPTSLRFCLVERHFLLLCFLVASSVIPGAAVGLVGYGWSS